jgi:hypothetical protein
LNANRFQRPLLVFCVLCVTSVHGQDGPANPISPLQSPLVLPPQGLKYSSTLRSTKNGRELASVVYDFELKKPDRNGTAIDQIVALLIPTKFARNLPFAKAPESLPNLRCSIHLTQSQVESISIAPTQPIPREQNQANRQIMGLLLSRVDRVGNPSTQPGAIFGMRSASSEIALSGAIIRSVKGHVISLDLVNPKGWKANDSGSAAASFAGAHADPYVGNCQLDDRTGWMTDANVSQVLKFGNDVYIIQVTVHQTRESPASQPSTGK